jgi:hypothetical protein
MKTKIILIICLVATFISCRKEYNPYSNDPNDPDYFYNRPVGASANEILTNTKFTTLKIEIQYMTGYAPTSGAIIHLQNLLNSILNKTSVIVIAREIPASASTVLDIDQVLEIEKNNRTVFTTGNEFAVYLLCTNGFYSDDKVLGAAYRNSSMVLFGKKVNDNSGNIGQPGRTKLEATVIEHEFGHLLGLVDAGSNMQINHRDAAHGHHCNNTNCLMYYSADTQDIFGFLITGSIPSFDSNCLADLRANGGK